MRHGHGDNEEGRIAVFGGRHESFEDYFPGDDRGSSFPNHGRSAGWRPVVDDGTLGTSANRSDKMTWKGKLAWWGAAGVAAGAILVPSLISASTDSVVESNDYGENRLKGILYNLRLPGPIVSTAEFPTLDQTDSPKTTIGKVATFEIDPAHITQDKQKRINAISVKIKILPEAYAKVTKANPKKMDAGLYFKALCTSPDETMRAAAFEDAENIIEAARSRATVLMPKVPVDGEKAVNPPEARFLKNSVSMYDVKPYTTTPPDPNTYVTGVSFTNTKGTWMIPCKPEHRPK